MRAALTTCATTRRCERQQATIQHSTSVTQLCRHTRPASDPHRSVPWLLAIPRSPFPGPSASYFRPRGSAAGGTKPPIPRAAANPPAVAPTSLDYFQVPPAASREQSPARYRTSQGFPPSEAASFTTLYETRAQRIPFFFRWALAVGPELARPQSSDFAQVWSDGTVMLAAVGRNEKRGDGQLSRLHRTAALRPPPRLRLVRFDG